MNKFKVTLYDRVIGYFNPGALNRRILERARSEIFLRDYDAAKNYSQNPIKKSTKSANKEVSKAISPVREAARELIRNQPFARKGVSVIVNGVVGWGIEASIKHPDQKREAKIKQLWDDWSKNLCSVNNLDFYEMQHQIMSAVVADGEVFLREVAYNNSIRLQILESDYLNSVPAKGYELQQDQEFVNGIILDKYTNPVSYNLFTRHPGDGKKNQTEFVPATKIIHVFKQERPGQNRGISWLAPVVQSVNMLSELQWTQLVRMKLAASLTAVVTSNPSSQNSELLKQQRDEEWALEPGSVRYIEPGEQIEFPTIPNPEGFSAQTQLVLKEIASGLGITYEALSGDLSQVNFSSGRLGDLQFRANVDQWRWHMLIPKFCNPAFERFKKYCELKGVNTEGVTVEWVPPARQMINPTDEISSTVSALRAGLQTLPNALKELGYNPESHLNEISKSNELLDKLGLIFDSDPRRIANQQLQSPDSNPFKK